MKDLKECPFCGKTETLKIVKPKDNNIAISCENNSAVCCDFNKGGCGASSGYRDDAKEAIEHWNYRPEEDK